MSIKTQGHGEKFSRRKEAAIAALLQFATLPEAASACKLSPRTLRRWLSNAEFEEAYRAARGRFLEGTINLLTRKSFAAAETLAGIADGTIVPTASRFAAARAIVELALRGKELQEVEERLIELEALAKENP